MTNCRFTDQQRDRRRVIADAAAGLPTPPISYPPHAAVWLPASAPEDSATAARTGGSV